MLNENLTIKCCHNIFKENSMCITLTCGKTTTKLLVKHVY